MKKGEKDLLSGAKLLFNTDIIITYKQNVSSVST